jgi:hypothetical protein
MMDSEVARGTADSRVAPESQDGRRPKRGDSRGETPLIVEVAWLVIETATALARLRRVLARL